MHFSKANYFINNRPLACPIVPSLTALLTDLIFEFQQCHPSTWAYLYINLVSWCQQLPHCVLQSETYFSEVTHKQAPGYTKYLTVDSFSATTHLKCDSAKVSGFVWCQIAPNIPHALWGWQNRWGEETVSIIPGPYPLHIVCFRTAMLVFVCY